jgi:hypothetical protein
VLEKKEVILKKLYAQAVALGGGQLHPSKVASDGIFNHKDELMFAFTLFRRQ